MYPEAGGSSSFARHAFNEFWSFFAAWAQMLNYIDHDRDLGVLRAALHRRAVLGAAAHVAGRHHLRHRRDRRAAAPINVVGVKESAGVNIVLAVVDFADAAAAGARRRGPRPLARDADRQRRPRRRADVEGLLPRDPDRDDRLHGHRDDLEHGRGGQGRDDDDPGGDQPRRHRRLRDLRGAAGGRAVGAAGRRRTPRRASTRRCSGLPRGRGRLRGRPDPRRRQARSTSACSRAPPRSTSACSPRRSSSSRRTRASSASRGSSTRWGSTARCPTGCASCTRSTGRRGSGSSIFGAIACLDADPGPGRLPRQHVRVRRDAVVHDRAPRGDPAARQASPTASGRTAGPGNSRVRGVDLPLFAVLGGLGTGLAFVVVTLLHLDVAIAGHRLAGARRAPSTSRLPPQPGARPDDHDEGRDPAARSSISEAEYDSVLVAFDPRSYSPERRRHGGQARGAPAARHPRARARSPSQHRRRSTPSCPSRRRAAQAIIEQAKLQGGRRVSGHYEKVRAGQAGRLIVEEAQGDARAGDRHAAAAARRADRSSARRSRPCSPSARAASSSNRRRDSAGLRERRPADDGDRADAVT